MGDSVVEGKFHALGIYHEESQDRRTVAVEKRSDKGVYAYGLSATRGARDKEVRHLPQISEAGNSGDVTPKRDQKRLGGIGEFGDGEHGAEAHGGFRDVRYLDAD